MKTKSKKQLVAAIVAGLTLATAAPAFAAANPFVDVPAKHWAYDAVSKLAAAGIIDGYGDGTFRGDRMTTRYEMAQIVGKAMANQDKANAEQKAMIDKLAQEFGDELKSLGVRVSTLENKVGNIKWSGQVREWYEWRDADAGSDKTNLNTRLLLFMDAPLTDEINFKGRFWAESGWGQTTHAGTGADASLDQAYLEGKHGNLSWTLGRQGIMLGKGLIYAWFPNNDGATLTFAGNKTKMTLAAFKNEALLTSLPIDLNIIAANITHQASDDLDLTLAYAKNKKEDYGIELINSWALGTTYKGIDNITLTAEYGQNNSDFSKNWDGDSAKAWVAQAKYKGAQWDKPKSWGLWVGYRNADIRFFGRNGDYIWETPTNIATYNSFWDGGYLMDNVKGLDYGFDYTVFKNGILTLQYFDLESDTDLAGSINNKESFTAQLRYMF